MRKYLFIIFIFISFKTLAVCQSGIDGDYGYINITFGNVIVQRDAPVGSILANTNKTISAWEGCDVNWTLRWELDMFKNQSPLAGVYDTNIKGVGFKITGNAGAVVPFDEPIPALTYSRGLWGPFEIQLIKTTAGPTGSGLINNGRLALNSIVNGPYYAEMDLVGTNKITTVACAITTPSLSFPIGDVSAATFGTTVGFSPTGAQNTQNLGLDCDAGANINVMLQGTQNPDVSASSVLALTGQGNADVAQGVGVQLLYNGAPLELNNRIVLKQSEGGQETFPITARYYQTKTSVSTGKANASATLDLTYQ